MHSNGVRRLRIRLRDFADHVDGRQFQALSPGLGVGRVRAHEVSKADAVVAPSLDPPSLTEQPRNKLVSGGSYFPPKRHRKQRASAGPSAWSLAGPHFSLEWGSLLYGLFIDFLVLTFAVVCAGCLVTAYFSLGDQGSAFWISGGPAQWFLDYKPWQGGLVFLGAAIAYGLLFRVVMGRTIGRWIAVGSS